MTMPLKHDEQPLEKWRDGVMTRMRVSALTGAHQLCIFEQYCDPGLGAPIHIHAVEEVLEVVAGTAEIWLGEGKHIVGPNQSVLVPAGARHGFRNIGETTLHVRATLAAPIFEAAYDDKREASRRYSPGY
jgi:mannose-6-phosphate isomerase-like protein (cupin superfamily)